MNTASLVGTIIVFVETQTRLAGKKIQLYALSASRDAKTFNFPQLPSMMSSASVPYEPPGETFTT